VRGRLIVLGLVLFVAVDVLLVALAFRHVDSPPRPDASRRTVSASPTDDATTPPTTPTTPTTTPTRTPTTTPPATPPTPAPTASRAPAPVSGPIDFVAIGDDRTILRTARGDCRTGEPLTVAVSRGGDRDTTARPVPDLTEVLAARVAPRGDLEIVGLDARCRVARYTSANGGRSWTRRAGADDTWHLAAEPTASTVVSPTGERPTPCVPIALAPVDDSLARVLCRRGRIRETEDAGRSWVVISRVRGAVDLRFTAPDDGVALARRPGCPAAVMQTSDGGEEWTRLVCLPGRRPRAIGAQGDVVAAQVGDELFVSTDAGATWPAATDG
jgi:hypothetical protein